MTDVVLQQRDLDVLQALCEDRAECGPGVPRAELEQIAATRWLPRILRRLHNAGHLIGSVGTDERYQLLDPLQSTEAPDEVRPAVVPQVGRSSGASVGGKLFELPPTPHYRQEAA